MRNNTVRSSRYEVQHMWDLNMMHLAFLAAIWSGDPSLETSSSTDAEPVASLQCASNRLQKAFFCCQNTAENPSKVFETCLGRHFGAAMPQLPGGLHAAQPDTGPPTQV